MNVNCAIFEAIYNIISESTVGITVENSDIDFINLVLYDLECNNISENCITQYNCNNN